MGDYNRADKETTVLEFGAQAQHVHIVSYSQIVAHLVFFDVEGADYDYDFSMVAQLAEHAQFAVGLETGEDAACVIVVEKFSSQL